MKEQLLESVTALSGCSPEQIEEVLSIVKQVEIGNGQSYIRAGEIPRSFAFVVKGLFRYYYADNKGNEFTKGFFPENSYITAYSALLENRESYFTIEALEDSTIFIIDFYKWNQIARNDICWLKFLVSLLEKGYCVKEYREREFLVFSAEERYESFLRRFPGLEKRIKQHYIASYLGITPESLSRIRKKMGKINIG